jgi:hypothetical protein
VHLALLTLVPVSLVAELPIVRLILAFKVARITSKVRCFVWKLRTCVWWYPAAAALALHRWPQCVVTDGRVRKVVRFLTGRIVRAKAGLLARPA